MAQITNMDEKFAKCPLKCDDGSLEYAVLDLWPVITFDSPIKKERSMLVFFFLFLFLSSLVKSILRSPGGKLFLELVFILLVRLQSVKIALEPVALH